jgi:hypothetical protein
MRVSLAIRIEIRLHGLQKNYGVMALIALKGRAPVIGSEREQL